MGLLDKATQAMYYEGNDYGSYQFTSLHDIITQFQIAYVGEDKIISKIKRVDIAFHAQRALQELSFDTFKSIKSQEIDIPTSLIMVLPQDYVNYTGISWTDSAGIKHPLYPTNRTSSPFRPQMDSNGEYLFSEKTSTDGTLRFGEKGYIYPNKLIESGDLITNGDFVGGDNGWDLNVLRFHGNYIPPYTASGTAANPRTNSRGWFWNNNSIIGYQVRVDTAFKQENLPIVNGEQYTITYTISGYSEGAIQFDIVDQHSNYTSSTERSANGTYTETLTAGGVETGDWAGESYIVFRSSGTATLNATIDSISMIRVGDDETSTTSSNYKSATSSENNNDDYEDNTYWPAEGKRYGLDPQHAQVNGSFYIDQQQGKIHFSSNMSGETIVLDYISDSLGTDEEMRVHKFAEDAMYKSIAYAILSTKANVSPSQVNRFKREKFAAIRTAKLRLSNIKLEELTQTLRGKSKHIKH